MKEAKQISKINPKPTIQAAGIKSAIHQRIVTLDHHKPFALKTIHPSPFENDQLSNPIHDQCDTTGQKSPAEDCRSKRQVPTMGMCPIEKVTDATLHH
jgi:hypothetical protein